MLDAALSLLLALCTQDAAALLACCQLGFCPAVLRFALPGSALELRLQVRHGTGASAGHHGLLCGRAWHAAAHPPPCPLPQAAAFAGVLCRASPASVAQLVACQGVPFLRDMIDEQQQHMQQLELAGEAVACFWLLLRRAAAAQPSFPVSANQLMRLLAHHNLPLRLIRLLPRLMHAQQQAAAAVAEAEQVAARGPGGEAPLQPRHVRAPSMPQTDAELALLSNDELAAAASSLALARAGDEEPGGYSSGGGACGYSSPERDGSGSSSPSRAQRWLGRALPGSPSRCGWVQLG